MPDGNEFIPGKITYMPATPTLRDQFAMMAMNGAFRCDPTSFYMTVEKDREALCMKAYVWADAMLMAREYSR